jgi:hypothetical protein
VNQQKRKYNNIKVYFDPVKGVAYWEGLFGTREFRLVKELNSSTLKRCYQFDSMHEYYCYRIVSLNLPIGLQLLRQVNFLVIPKSDLGSAVTYRADLVVVPIEIDEKSIRYWAMQTEPIPFDFLIVEPKGILTETARLKHLMLCASNKVTMQQILFVASNYASLNLPGEIKSSLFHLAGILKEKFQLIFGEQRMEVETTPWHETRSLISPQIEMLQEDGMIQYKGSFLKDESPKTATLKKRFIQYDANYVKYCLLKEFYQLLFDAVRQHRLEGSNETELTDLLAEVIIDFLEYCREQPSEENARELFRTFCKVHLFI